MHYKIPGICAVLFVIPLFVHAQSGVIKGTVMDGNTNQPLPYASVYFNYTTIGTYTDSDGQFVLSGLPEGEYDLIVSFVGHHPYQKKFKLTDGGEFRLTIRLKVNALNEVQVKAKRDVEWEKQLKKFKKLFLGNDENAKHCKILNPWSLTFQETKNGLFMAQASETLEIENLSLGYRISYQLKNFSVNKGNYLVTGYVRFDEFKSLDSLVREQWLTNRDEAFKGSSRHLFKTMIEHCLKEEEYELYEDKSGLSQVVRTYRFLTNLDKTIFDYSTDGKIYPVGKQNVWSIQLPGRLEVHYKEKNVHSRVYWDVPYAVSWIEVKGGFVNVTEDGIVLNPAAMTLSGDMFDARIAGILPNDYQPEIEYIPGEQPIEKKPLSALVYLTEKPYLNTDKSYYYENEVIWFKGYMNYFSPLVKDSLSRVLYVDLMTADNRIVSSSVIPISDGVAVGDLRLPASVQKGDYTLRAYTRWMLNFDSTFMFVKALKILDTDERVSIKDYQPEESTDILITTDKQYYDLREKITLRVDVRNQVDQRIPAELSISVTDLEQAFPARNETTIVSDFTMPLLALPDTIDKGTTHRIQHGFDFQGTFVPSRGKNTQGLITLVQEDANIEFTITTGEDGSFFIPNLLLYDTSHFSIAARTLKGRPGNVIVDSVVMAPPFRSTEPLQLEIYRTDTPIQHYVAAYSQPAIMLEEVSVKASRLESKKRTFVTMADYEVTGEWLRDNHITDVLSGIRMRVPGLRILIRGDFTKVIILGPPSSFGGLQSQEPLVLIDNIVVNDYAGGPAEQIERLSPSEIESIEVTKFGNGAAYGARGGNGIISIHTRRGNSDQEYESGSSYDKNTLQPIHTSGFSTIRKFISPDYSTPGNDDGVPDNRSTLYWNPTLSIDGKTPGSVSFFAADLVTQYRITVEGVTRAGNAVRGEQIISIGKLP